MIKLIGIIIVVLGFALKLDPIGTVIIAIVTTGLAAGQDIVGIMELLGKTFVANRYMCLFIIILPAVGLLERNGLSIVASNVIRKIKSSTPSKIITIYGLMRTFFAALNVNFGGVASFTKPIIYPMAAASLENRGIRLSSKDRDSLKGLSAAQENISWFFGQVLFVAGPGVILVKSSLDNAGFKVEPIEAVKAEIPVIFLTILVTAIYMYIVSNRIISKYNRESLLHNKAEADE
ncbi:MAG: DUF969 family protein [Tissierellales bacterium]